MEKLMVYFAMLFAVILELIQIAYQSNMRKWKTEQISKASKKWTSPEEE